MTVTPGRKVPAFSLPATGNGQWSLKEMAGRQVVLYFYPRDNTSGCTLEAREFAALAGAFRRAGTVIAGISADSPASHGKFKTKLDLPFELLADVDQSVCRLFDVIREKSLYGRKYVGIERSTFLIDARGVLRQEWRKVKVSGHAAEVLAAAKSLHRA